MDSDEKLRIAVIAGASNALKQRKTNPLDSTEDNIKKVSDRMEKILKKLGTSELEPLAELMPVAVIAGASRALKYAERHEKAREKEIMTHVSDEMDNIINNIDK